MYQSRDSIYSYVKHCQLPFHLHNKFRKFRQQFSCYVKPENGGHEMRFMFAGYI